MKDRSASLLDLTIALVWRELALRYKRSLFGVLWALAEPLFLIATYVLFFGWFLRAGASVPDYTFYVVFGTLPWIFLASTLDQASSTMIEHAPLARKIPFPWEILFVAVGVSRLTTMLVGLALGLGAAVALATSAQWRMLVCLPLGLVTLVTLAFGGSLIVGALQPLFRDTSYLVRYGMRLAFYAVPIAYPLSLVPERMAPWFVMNPFVGLLWLFQAPFAVTAPPVWAVVWSVVFAVLVLFVGVVFFRRMRGVVADLL